MQGQSGRESRGEARNPSEKIRAPVNVEEGKGVRRLVMHVNAVCIETETQVVLPQ